MDFNEIFDIFTDVKKEIMGSESIVGMATFRKNRSGLPVNVYLDDSMDYKGGGHGKRIKFQPDKGDHPVTRNFATMTIADEPRVIGEHELSGKELRELTDFVKRNREALESLSDMVIDFADFLQIVT
jgi:hypothetical protein